MNTANEKQCARERAAEALRNALRRIEPIPNGALRQSLLTSGIQSIHNGARVFDIWLLKIREEFGYDTSNCQLRQIFEQCWKLVDTSVELPPPDPYTFGISPGYFERAAEGQSAWKERFRRSTPIALPARCCAVGVGVWVIFHLSTEGFWWWLLTISLIISPIVIVELMLNKLNRVQHAKHWAAYAIFSPDPVAYDLYAQAYTEWCGRIHEVFVTRNGRKYHRHARCHNMWRSQAIPKYKAEKLGYLPCSSYYQKSQPNKPLPRFDTDLDQSSWIPAFAVLAFLFVSFVNPNGLPGDRYHHDSGYVGWGYGRSNAGGATIAPYSDEVRSDNGSETENSSANSDQPPPSIITPADGSKIEKNESRMSDSTPGDGNSGIGSSNISAVVLPSNPGSSGSQYSASVRSGGNQSQPVPDMVGWYQTIDELKVLFPGSKSDMTMPKGSIVYSYRKDSGNSYVDWPLWDINSIVVRPVIVPAVELRLTPKSPTAIATTNLIAAYWPGRVESTSVRPGRAILLKDFKNWVRLSKCLPVLEHAVFEVHTKRVCLRNGPTDQSAIKQVYTRRQLVRASVLADSWLAVTDSVKFKQNGYMRLVGLKLLSPKRLIYQHKLLLVSYSPKPKIVTSSNNSDSSDRTMIKAMVEQEHPDDLQWQQMEFDAQYPAYEYLKQVPDNFIKRKAQSDHPSDYQWQEMEYDAQYPAYKYMESLPDNEIKKQAEHDHPGDFQWQEMEYEAQYPAQQFMMSLPNGKLKTRVQNDHPGDYQWQEMEYQDCFPMANKYDR